MALKRNKNSHKGDNGKVLVIGGNEIFHGAPILAGLGAEKSGVDLVYLLVPVQIQPLARSFSLNLIVDDLSGSFLCPKDLQKVTDFSKKADVLVIGNGLGDMRKSLATVQKILQQSTCKLVIDASALDVFVTIAPLKGREVLITPHRGELERITGISLEKMTQKELKVFLTEKAKQWSATIVLKGSEDLIVSPEGNVSMNKTGHPIMTKGGTGDVLAGLIGGLMAQGLSGFEAAKKATRDWGKVGEYVAKQKGLEVTVKELLEGMKKN